MHGLPKSSPRDLVTMMRLPAILSLSLVVVVLAANSAAQPLTAGPASSLGEGPCPQGRMSIYYASRDVDVSQQTEALIGLISAHAIACRADGLDLIARIDSRIDGDGALAIALQRLGDIAGEFIARGVPAESLRIAAQSVSSVAAPNLNQIDVIFRKAAPADAVAAPTAATRPTPTDSI